MGKLRMMRLVMKKIKVFAMEENCWSDDKTKSTHEYTNRMWELIGEKYINTKYTGSRNSETSWKTVYNNMVKKKRRRSDE
jgi:hypothetical protein